MDLNWLLEGTYALIILIACIQPFLMCVEDVTSRKGIWRTYDGESPLNKTFWEIIFDIYCKITMTQIPNSLNITLLSIIPGPFKIIKKVILCNLISAVRVVIPHHYKPGIIPSLPEWAKELDSFRDLETMLSQENDKLEQYRNTSSTERSELIRLSIIGSLAISSLSMRSQRYTVFGVSFI